MKRIPWSIQQIIRNDEAEWRSANKHRQQNESSALGREILFAGEHPVRFSISICVLLAAIFALLVVVPQTWADAIFSTLTLTKPINWGPSDHLAYFTSLWAIQATLAALVYPIVIAFVTVFLQRRPSSEAYLHVYLLDSGALVAGLSSLSLLIFMAGQYLIIKVTSLEVNLLWVVLDALWFILNGVLTTYFLYRTIDFLRPDVQTEVLKKYTLSVALPRDVARLNAAHIFFNLQHQGWISAPQYLSEDVKVGAKVLLYPYAFERGGVQVTRSFKSLEKLYDVRIWPLSFAISRWVKTSEVWLKDRDTSEFSKRDWPLLTIPLQPGRSYEDSVELATVSSGPSLSWFQRKLLRFSFVFKPQRSESYGISVKTVMGELEADARQAAFAADVPAFERAYSSLLNLHQALLGACLTTDSLGKASSWALLEDNQVFFGQSLHSSWAESYRSLFDAAVGLLPRELRPLQRLCHLIQHLGNDEFSKSPVEIRQNGLAMSTVLMYKIGNWWTLRIEEQGFSEHDHAHMATLNPPLRSTYEEILSTFASGWESARDVVARIPDRADFDWTSASFLAQLSASHIRDTARMLLTAVSRGDRAAAHWFADVMSKWSACLDDDRQSYALYGRTAFITIQHLKLNWSEILIELGVEEEELTRHSTPVADSQRDILIAALENFWIDIRLLTIELLLAWAASDGKDLSQNSLALEIVIGLFDGKVWKAGGEPHKPLTQLTAADYLTSKARQYAASGVKRGDYIHELDRFVERIKQLEQPSMVSSRMYSFSGVDDVSSLQQSQLVLFAVLSTAEWKLGDTLAKQIDVWMATKYENIDILRSQAKAWQELFAKKDGIPLSLLKALLVLLQKNIFTLIAKKHTEVGLQTFRDYLDKGRETALAAAAVSETRLIEMAKSSSKTGFNLGTAEFPIHLFNSLSYRETSLKDFTVLRKGVGKGELTDIPMDQRAINESDWLDKTLSQYVGSVVLNDVLDSLTLTEVVAADPKVYWRTIKDEAEKLVKLKLTPLLILDNRTRPLWVWDWQHAHSGSQYERPPDLIATHLPKSGKGYVGHFNQIQVYSGRITNGQSLMIARETLDSVSFTKYAEDQYVKVTANIRTDSPVLVDLALKFSREVQLKKSEGLRILYEIPSNAGDQKDQ